MNAMCIRVLKDYRETVDSNRETAETVETTGDTCKYEIVWRNRDWKRLKGLGRLWRPVEIHECNVYGGTEGLERL